jgi:hypothetical protein
MGILNNILHRNKDAPEIAADVAMLIAEESFKKFREQGFRDVIGFAAMDQEEQDRVFNEFVVTGLCLVYLTLERGEDENPNEKSRDTFRQIKNNLTGGYVKTLAGTGVEKEFTDLWYQLVAMRCEEYRQDYETHKEVFTDKRENYWVHVCAIGGSDHICRSEDPVVEKLLPQISRWCGQLYINCMRAIAKELNATIAATGKPTQLNINDDGTLDLK